MKTMRNSKLLLALFALVLILGACKGESPTAPPTGGGGGGGGGTTNTFDMALTASNASPVVDSTSIITATVTLNGSPAPNGTAVQFTASGGALDGEGTSTIKTTTGGVASVTLTSTVVGPITVNAVVANVSRTVTVTFRAGTVPPVPPPTTPSIESITPSIGRPQGGETIRIVGKNFKSPVRVLFDTGAALPVEAFVVSATDTVIEVLTPAVNLGSGQELPVDVVVITQAGTATEARVERADGFTFRNEQLIPVINTASPNSGPVTGGTRVTIFGEGFQAPVQVLFDTAEARVINVDFSQIIVEAPTARDTSPDGSGAVTGPVDITVRNIQSGTSDTMTDGFLYKAAVTITAVSPGSGPRTGGTRVQIDGIGFVGPVSVVVRTSEGDVTLLPINVTGTRIIALTPSVAIADCEDLDGPIIVTNIVNGDQAEGPPFVFNVDTPIIIDVDSDDDPVTLGSLLQIRVLNAGLFPQLTIGPNGATITGATTGTDGVTTLTVVVPPGTVLQTRACPGGGSREVATTFPITFVSAETGCEVTLPGGVTVEPEQVGQFFLTPNPLEITAEGDDPVTPEDEEQDGSGTFTIVNTGAEDITITSITTNNPNIDPAEGGVIGQTLAPCESTVVAVTYEAGATGSTETATITVTGSSAAQVITARLTVIGETN